MHPTRPPIPPEPSLWALRIHQILPHAIFGALLIVAASSGYGVWWYLHRRPDPVVHAAMRERLGDLRETVLLQRDQVAAQPADPAARLRLAQILLRVYDGEGAEGTFRTAERLGADRWVVAQGLGAAYIVQGDWRRVLAELPDTAPTPQIAAPLLLMRATAQIALQRLPAATATLAVARRAAPAAIEPLLIAGRLSLATGDADAAEASTQAALKLDPTSIDALFLEHRLATGRHDLPGAIVVADRILALYPWSLPARLDRADLMMSSDRDAEAGAEIETVLSRFPKLTGGLYLRAMLVARAGDDEKTLVALEQLGASIDSFPRALLLDAVLSARLGRIEAARILAIRFNARFPENREGVVLLAQNHLSTNRADLALPLLEKAMARAKPGAPADAELLALLGTTYAATGNPAAALRLRENAAAAAPDNARILNGLGLSQLGQGDVTAALESLDHSAANVPPSTLLSDTLFGAALGAGDLDRAEAALGRRRAQDGDTEQVGTMSALLVLARGDVQAATAAFRALMQRYPDAIIPRVNLAKLLAASDRLPEAETLLKALLVEDPTSMAAVDAIVPLLVQQKRFDDAISAAEVAEAAAPGNPRFTALRTELLMAQGNPKAAVALLEDRQQSKKLDRSLIITLAQAQAAAGDTDGALVTYATVLRAAPGNTAARFAQVNLLLLNKLPGSAATSLREALTQTPGLATIMLAMVSLEASSNGLDAALAMAGDLRANPVNRPAAALLQGDLLMQAARPSPAASAYRAEFDAAPTKALALRLAIAESAAGHADIAANGLRDWSVVHPDDPDVALALAKLDLRAGRWEQAQSVLETRLRRRPNDASALNNLAWLYQLKADPRAFDLASRSYQLQRSPQAADTLGWLMLAKGDVPKATTLLKAAFAEAPEDPTIAYHLATAYQKGGSVAASVKLLKPLVAGAAAFDDRENAISLLRQMKPAQ